MLPDVVSSGWSLTASLQYMLCLQIYKQSISGDKQALLQERWTLRQQLTYLMKFVYRHSSIELRAVHSIKLQNESTLLLVEIIQSDIRHNRDTETNYDKHHQ